MTRLRRPAKRMIQFLMAVFVAPALLSLGWTALEARPHSWRDADWSASGVLARDIADGEAGIWVLAAKTGGLKGAFSVHSWIVTRGKGEAPNRHEVVGWGLPVRQNAYPVDAHWYSNTPFVVGAVRGAAAERLIPRIDAAIAAYPYARRGDYTLWPGPNSNSFVAHVLRQVPELDVAMPANATGRDFRPGLFSADFSDGDLHLTLHGLAGLAAGMRSGLELHFMGLVAGIDLARPGLKIPGWGRVGL